MSVIAPSTDDPRPKLAAEMFPREWARVANATGASKARQKLRQRAESEVKLRALRAEGAACANCRSFKKRHMGTEMMCSTHSDFYGDVIAKPDGLCTGHQFAPSPTHSA